jgi:hypothetical protein
MEESGGWGMRILATIPLILMLAACGGTKNTLMIEETVKVAMPPAELLECPDVRLPETVTKQSEVADYVLELYQGHQICKQHLEKVKTWLIKADKITEDGK